MRIRIKNGFDIPIDGAARKASAAALTVRRVALVGSDFGDLWPSLAVAVGEPVRAGSLLFRDRKNPAICFTAPASGVVADIRLGRGGRLTALVIDTTDAPPLKWDPLAARGCDMSAATIRERLLASGLWTALRARPYERIAQPEILPRAIFITAMDTRPLAPDPLPIINEDVENFRAGVSILSRLTEGPTYVCTAPAAKVPLPDDLRVEQREFAGPHPAGLPGTHMHALKPEIGSVPDLWHVGYQDVSAIGRLMRLGEVSTHKTIAVCGPGILEPCMVRAPIGAELSQLVSSETQPRCRLISGSVLSGRANPGFLGRYHNQLTVLVDQAPENDGAASRLLRLLLPGSAAAKLRRSLSAGRREGMLPLESFDRVWPYSTPAAALLRALLIGDGEQALQLGCIGLAEEDMALCTFLCAGESDYGNALRRVLNDAESTG